LGRSFFQRDKSDAIVRDMTRRDKLREKGKKRDMICRSGCGYSACVYRRSCPRPAHGSLSSALLALHGQFARSLHVDRPLDAFFSLFMLLFLYFNFLLQKKAAD
jgi:hypothetical protein